MKNYTILENNLKDETANYIKNITLGLGKVDTHFITDILLKKIIQNLRIKDSYWMVKIPIMSNKDIK